MCQHDPGATVCRRVRDDFAQREVRARLVSIVASQVHAARIAVEVRDEQALPLGVRIGKAAGKKLPRAGEAIDHEREFGTLISHGRSLCAGLERGHRKLIRNGARMD